MKLKFKVPHWYAEFSRDLEESFLEDQWQEGKYPGKLRRAKMTLQLLYSELTIKANSLYCEYFGCDDLVDYDPGDPEVGPNPQIYCRRCGRRQ